MADELGPFGPDPNDPDGRFYCPAVQRVLDRTEPDHACGREDRHSWAMPVWMEPYRPLINNTGGNTVEDLINRLKTSKNLMLTNVVAFSLACMVHAQVTLLRTLRHEGMLGGSDG